MFQGMLVGKLKQRHGEASLQGQLSQQDFNGFQKTLPAIAHLLCLSADITNAGNAASWTTSPTGMLCVLAGMQKHRHCYAAPTCLPSTFEAFLGTDDESVTTVSSGAPHQEIHGLSSCQVFRDRSHASDKLPQDDGPPRAGCSRASLQEPVSGSSTEVTVIRTTRVVRAFYCL